MPKTMNRLRSVAFLTLGCRVNQAEDASYRQHSLESGWQLVDFKQQADIYIINTCTVTLEAERQSRQMIRQAKRRNPKAVLVVTGCAGRALERQSEIANMVDLFIPNLTKENLVPELRRFLGETQHPELTYHFPPIHQSRQTRLNLKITDGCFEACAFCIIPAVRGTVRSLDDNTVIQRIQEAEQLGYQEVILTGIHLGAYGHERGIHGLETLLERINTETTIPSIRLSSIDPHEISDRMIAAMAHSPRICPYLHIPIQSGSDRILTAMRRRDRHHDMLDKVAAIRTLIPNMSFSTDVIVGFPGETEADFQQTLKLIEAIGFHKLHVFPYSVRPGTRAAFMKEHVEPEIRNERAQRLLETGKRLRKQWFTSWVGQPVRVLIEKVSTCGEAKGYTSHYLRVQISRATPQMRNTFQKVTITGFDLDAEVVTGKIG